MIQNRFNFMETSVEMTINSVTSLRSHRSSNISARNCCQFSAHLIVTYSIFRSIVVRETPQMFLTPFFKSKSGDARILILNLNKLSINIFNKNSHTWTSYFKLAKSKNRRWNGSYWSNSTKNENISA